MKKLSISVLLILCGAVIIGSIVENVMKSTTQTSKAGSQEEEPADISITLTTDLDFSTVSPYTYANGNGQVVANITSNSLHDDPPELRVTLKIIPIKPKNGRTLNTKGWKKINGTWYYQDNDIEIVPDDHPTFNANSSREYSYRFVTPVEHGTSRIIYLFRGNWCSVEFEI